MWISARDALPGISRDCIVCTGSKRPFTASLELVMDVGGAWVTAWVSTEHRERRASLNEGDFWIRLPELPQL
jgi:hypothetical protein